MGEFRVFTEDLFRTLGIEYSKPAKLPESDLAGVFLERFNKFLYQRDKKIGDDYISRFHKYWEKHHEEILQLKIDDSQCLKIAKVIEPIYAHPEKFPDYEIKPPISREGISNEAVANVRFFTAIQDFKINIHKGGRNPFEQYKKTPEWFTASAIVDDPSLITSFLRYLEAAGSQGDKRQKWMLEAAEFLVL
ncbi:hypothetical protein ACFLYB_04505 [Chloroflexota bacterium]